MRSPTSEPVVYCSDCEHPSDEHDAGGCHAFDNPHLGIIYDCDCSGLNQSLTNFAGTPEAYVDLISDRWDWNYGTMFVTEMASPYWEVKLVTGGWSANEEVLSQLERTVFHVLYWEFSHRGGLHVYHVGKSLWTCEYKQLGDV